MIFAVLPLFIGFGEILVILVITLLVFGPKKLPEIARGLGQAMRMMRNATDEIKEEIMKPAEDIPVKEIETEINKAKEQVKQEAEDILGSVKRNL